MEDQAPPFFGQAAINLKNLFFGTDFFKPLVARLDPEPSQDGAAEREPVPAKDAEIVGLDKA